VNLVLKLSSFIYGSNLKVSWEKIWLIYASLEWMFCSELNKKNLIQSAEVNGKKS